jgi:predicted  nucleic acid-binding Zn-ribbon protein
VTTGIIASFANLVTEGVRKLTTDLRGKLRPQVERMHNCANDVKKAIDLAKATADRKEQEFQEQERKLAAKHRTQLSIFTSRIQKELESATKWQMQRDKELLSKVHDFLSILS